MSAEKSLSTKVKNLSSKEPILVSVYNQKGGVGKTTSAYNMGITLTMKLGLRVLLVDADPQCDLTARVFASQVCDGVEIEDLYKDWNAKFRENKKDKKEGEVGEIRTIGQLYFPSLNETDNFYPLNIRMHRNRASAFIPTEVPNYQNLYICPGSMDLADIGEQLSLALGGIKSCRSIPFFISGIFREIGRVNNFDMILFDLNPGSGSFNCCLLTGCDYFVTPFFPSFFSYQAIKRMKSNIPKWVNRINDAKELGFKDHRPKFLGGFASKVRTYRDRVIASMMNWLRRIYEECDDMKKSYGSLGMITKDYTLPKQIGIRDSHSTGMDMQKMERGMADDSSYFVSEFHREHNGKTRGKNERDIQKINEAARGYEKIVGMMLTNLEKKDLHRLPQKAISHSSLKTLICDEEDVVLNTPVTSMDELVRLQSEQKNKKRKKKRGEKKSPPSTKAKKRDEDEDDDRIDPWYDGTRIRQLLEGYFGDFPNVVIMEPTVAEGFALESNMYRKNLVDTLTTRVRNVEMFSRENHINEVVVVHPVNIGGDASHSFTQVRSGNHWALIVIGIPLIPKGGNAKDDDYKLTMFYTDPKGRNILNELWNEFVLARNIVFPERSVSRFYQILDPNTAAQNAEDNDNCGPFVVEYARINVNYILGRVCVALRNDPLIIRREHNTMLGVQTETYVGPSQEKKRKRDDEFDDDQRPSKKRKM